VGFEIERKEGQATIWIILGILLIGSIILFFSLYKDSGDIVPPFTGDSPDVSQFLSFCVEEATLEAIDLMLPHGGFIQPRNFVRFDGSDVEYLCETLQFYDACVQQHPMLLHEMEREIKEYISPRVDECFVEMEDFFNDRGWSMIYDPDFEVDVNLRPARVHIIVERDVTLEKENDRDTFTRHEVSYLTPAYDLAKVALEIAAQEGDPNRCNFEHFGYSLLYPRFDIDLYNQMPDSTKIYTINDTKSEKFMRIAIRSCVSPKGL